MGEPQAIYPLVTTILDPLAGRAEDLGSAWRRDEAAPARGPSSERCATICPRTGNLTIETPTSPEFGPVLAEQYLA